MDLQHVLYPDMLWPLAGMMMHQYKFSCRVVGVKTELYKSVFGKESFDHRRLQDIHDLIAAFYRHDFDPQLTHEKNTAQPMALIQSLVLLAIRKRNGLPKHHTLSFLKIG